MSAQKLPAGHDARAAWFWLGYHLKRNLRKKAFRNWSILVILALLVFRFGTRFGAAELGEFVVGFIAGIMALFFGSASLREEIEDQTLTYSFSRPVGRAWLYAARVLASGVPVMALVVPAAFLAGSGIGPQTATRYAIAAALATITYTGLFALAGQLIKWPAWFGLAFLLLWEHNVYQVAGFLGRVTVLSHVYGVAGLRPGLAGWAATWEAPSFLGGIIVLCAMTVATLWVGGQLVRRREFVLTR